AIDAIFVLKTNPRLGVGIFTLAFARQTALPAIGIEHRPGGVPVHVAKVPFNVIKDILMLLHHVSVGIDYKTCHVILLLSLCLLFERAIVISTRSAKFRINSVRNLNQTASLTQIAIG